MNLSRMAALALIAAALAKPGIATAAGQTADPGTGLQMSQPYSAQRDSILERLAGGDEYREITDADKERVKTLLSQLDGLVGDAQRLDELSVEAKVKAFNAQAEINTLLTRAHADSREVCEREQKVGSHRRTTVCMTVAARRRHREAAQDAMRKADTRKLDSGHL